MAKKFTRKIQGAICPMPRHMLMSQQFASLSPHAVKLLTDLMAQYTGFNNGDLCATWSLMHKRGWRSRDTLGKALTELEGTRFVQRTRRGCRPTKPASTPDVHAARPSAEVRRAGQRL